MDSALAVYVGEEMGANLEKVTSQVGFKFD